jgi:hypothetical protein
MNSGGRVEACAAQRVRQEQCNPPQYARTAKLPAHPLLCCFLRGHQCFLFPARVPLQNKCSSPASGVWFKWCLLLAPEKKVTTMQKKILSPIDRILAERGYGETEALWPLLNDIYALPFRVWRNSVRNNFWTLARLMNGTYESPEDPVVCCVC